MPIHPVMVKTVKDVPAMRPMHQRPQGGGSFSAFSAVSEE